MTDESKMTKSINISFERKLPFILLHQLFEALQPDDLTQGDVDGIGTGFCLKHFHGLVGEVGIKTD